MTVLTCPGCGESFETSARTNTRCRSCKTVVRVPAGTNGSQHAATRSRRGDDERRRPRPSGPALVVVRLGCGHVSAAFDLDCPAAAVVGREVECIEGCDEPQRATAVLGSLSAEQHAALGDDELLTWCSQFVPAGAS